MIAWRFAALAGHKYARTVRGAKGNAGKQGSRLLAAWLPTAGSERILPPRHCSRGERVATTEKDVSIPKGPIPNPGLAKVDYLSW